MDRVLTKIFQSINPDWINGHIWEILAVGIVTSLLLAIIPRWEQITDRFSRWLGYGGMVALLGMAFLVFYDITTRKLFHGGSIGLQELEWHLYAITFLFGIGYTLSVDKHVRVDILYTRYPTQLKWSIDLIALTLFIIPLTVLIIAQALPFVAESYLQQERSGDPGGLCCRWIIKSAILIGFIGLYLQTSGEIRKRILKLVKSCSSKGG